jgi:acetyltransferase-like isoleucine patch superfamily enzyme
MPGVTIGKGAIVSACAVVNKSVPAFAIVVGNPGRVVGWRKRPGDASGGSSAADAGSVASSAP